MLRNHELHSALYPPLSVQFVGFTVKFQPFSMESNSQYGSWMCDSSFMSLSVEGCDRYEQVAEPLTSKIQPFSKSNTAAEIEVQNTRPMHLKDDLPCQKISKGMKRVRCNGQELEDKSEFVLGLHCLTNISDSEGTTNVTHQHSSVDKANEHFSTELGLGLAHPFSEICCQPSHECLASATGLITSDCPSAVTSFDSEHNMHSYGKCIDINTSLALGSFQGGLKDLNHNILFRKSSGEHGCDSSGNSAVADFDCSPDMPLILEPACKIHVNNTDSIIGFQNIPLVDEGSTCARWMKSEGYIPFLVDQRLDSPTSNFNIMNQSSREGTETMERRPSISVKTSKKLGNPLEQVSKTCKLPGCRKCARGASGLCIAHGGGWRCQKQGCNKGAEGRTVYCKAHGGGRRCQSLGCTKGAEGKTEYCISHGGGRRCSDVGCTKAARGKSGLCIRHGGGKRCQKEGCTKSAEGYFGFCISHGGGRRCQFPGCGKGAQGSTTFCKAHGGGKRCMIQGCTKGAEGSTPLCKGHGGGKRCLFKGGGVCTKSVHGGTQFCVAHGGGKRCVIQGCTKSARGKTDCCVKHGGGKRCKFVSCGKSAQGSTDFCKAHGGGKRCLWGQESSPYNGEYIKEIAGQPCKRPCDKFARGKTGLCTAHNAVVQGLRMHGGVSMNLTSGIDILRGFVSDTKTGQSSIGSIDQLPDHFFQHLLPRSLKREQSSTHANDQATGCQNLNSNDQDVATTSKETLLFPGASHGARGGALRDEKVTDRDCFFQLLTASQPNISFQNDCILSLGRSNSSLSSVEPSGYSAVVSEPMSRSLAVACRTDITGDVAEKERLPTVCSVFLSNLNFVGSASNSSSMGPVIQSHRPVSPHVPRNPGVLRGTIQTDEACKMHKCIDESVDISSLSFIEERVHDGRLMSMITKERGVTGDFIQRNMHCVGDFIQKNVHCAGSPSTEGAFIG